MEGRELVRAEARRKARHRPPTAAAAEGGGGETAPDGRAETAIASRRAQELPAEPERCTSAEKPCHAGMRRTCPPKSPTPSPGTEKRDRSRQALAASGTGLFARTHPRPVPAWQRIGSVTADIGEKYYRLLSESTIKFISVVFLAVCGIACHIVPKPACARLLREVGLAVEIRQTQDGFEPLASHAPS